MIHDAKVEVTCDGEGCDASIEVEPPFMYRSMNAESGYYDVSDKAIAKLIAKEGWEVDCDQHFCSDCVSKMEGEE